MFTIGKFYKICFRLQESTWLETSSVEMKPPSSNCCSGINCNIMSIDGNENSEQSCPKYSSTNGVNVGPGSYMQFTLNMNCNQNPGLCECRFLFILIFFGEYYCFYFLVLEIQYSIDLGHTWLPLITRCHPTNTKCSYYHRGSTFASDVYQKTSGDQSQNRITLPLPGIQSSFFNKIIFYLNSIFRTQLVTRNTISLDSTGLYF